MLALQLVAEAATALAVGVAAWQLWMTKRQARTQFEDGLAREYREIVRRLPVEAMLGHPVSDAMVDQHLQDFYTYVDLTNEQIFLRRKGRVTKTTRNNWREGICDLMNLPAFQIAWRKLNGGPAERFNQLRLLAEDKFGTDPKKWPIQRVLRPAVPAVTATDRDSVVLLREGK